MFSITRPTLPPWKIFIKSTLAFYDTGILTNGPVVRQLETEVRDKFNVGNAVAVSSCTSGLMLALRCLGVKGKVAVPSFTFFATTHAVLWCGLEPVFVDVEEDTWNMSAEALDHAMEEESGIEAIMPVHVFGNPCDVAAIEAVAKEHGLKVIYDAAHAMGSKVGERWVGVFGDVEVFSLSPTKIVVAGEGGILTTGQDELAEKLRAGRNYGNYGDYDPEMVGLNARMSEFHAALAIESFRLLELNVSRRNRLAELYRQGLNDVPGIVFQEVKEGNRSTYKDMTIMVDEEKFGMSRDVLAWYLGERGIETRKYYYPPVHRTKAYWERWGKYRDEHLPVTNLISRRALSLPIWSHMEEEEVYTVTEALRRAHENADKISWEYEKTMAERP